MNAQLRPKAVRRGRPSNRTGANADSRALLIRTGLAILTEKGYSAAGVDEVLETAGVPKGSFYHYFRSKEEFGSALIASYAEYFAAKLDRWFEDESMTPVARLRAFVDDAKRGMARYGYRRGCLIGNLGQEMGALPESFRAQLISVFNDWQRRTERCLNEGSRAGEIAAGLDCGLLAQAFWIGWEGAVLRAKLERRSEPLEIFASGFLASLRASAVSSKGAPAHVPRRSRR